MYVAGTPPRASTPTMVDNSLLGPNGSISSLSPIKPKVIMNEDFLTETEVMNLWEDNQNLWEDDHDLLNTDYLDQIMTYNVEEPSQNILMFNLKKGFKVDNTHRIISRKDLEDLCPEAIMVSSNIERICKVRNTFLVFNREIFISVESKVMTKSVNKKAPRKCYLNGCNKIIETGESISYLAVVWPPNGNFCYYPFSSDAQNRHGAISCKLHGLASQNTDQIYYANSMYPKKLYNKVNCMEKCVNNVFLG